jgi:hypothetical protein
MAIAAPMNTSGMSATEQVGTLKIDRLLRKLWDKRTIFGHS